MLPVLRKKTRNLAPLAPPSEIPTGVMRGAAARFSQQRPFTFHYLSRINLQRRDRLAHNIIPVVLKGVTVGEGRRRRCNTYRP